jgi:hypothetical protein
MASKITVSNEMSRADVLKGLWNCSSPDIFFQIFPGNRLLKKQEAAAWQSKEKVEQIIQKKPYVNYFVGRCIKTDMEKYPEIDLASYKTDCKIAMSFSEIFEKCLRQNTYTQTN